MPMINPQNRFLETKKPRLVAKYILIGMTLSPLIVFGVILLVGCFLGQNFIDNGINVDMIAEPVSLRTFAIDQGKAGMEELGELHVWIENSPSMAGFVDTGRCPESFLPYMLQQSEHAVNTWFPATTKLYYHSFNATLAKQLEQAEHPALLRTAVLTDPAKALLKDFYLPESGIADVLDDSKNHSALTGLLSAIKPGQPHLIITDFLETAAVIENDPLQPACEALFHENLSIKVIALDSLFSGAIFDAGGEDEIFAFYVNRNSSFHNDNNKKRFSVGDQRYWATNIKTTNGYHAHPRPLYAIVIGTSRQCDTIAAVLLSQYEIYRTSLPLEKDVPEYYHMQNDRDENVLRQAQVFSFGQIGVEKVLRMVGSGQIVSEAAEQDGLICTAAEKDYDQQPLHADGVDAYRIIKDQALASQEYKIHYHFMPNVEGYAANHLQDQYTVGEMKTYQFVFNERTDEYDDAASVRVIGDRWLRYDMQDIPTPTNAFGIVNFDCLKQGIDFDLVIDVSAMETGFYRLELPFLLRRSAEGLSLDHRTAQAWNVQRGSITNSPAKTTDLYKQLENIYEAQKVLLTGESLVAQITIDIEIAAKE